MELYALGCALAFLVIVTVILLIGLVISKQKDANKVSRIEDVTKQLCGCLKRKGINHTSSITDKDAEIKINGKLVAFVKYDLSTYDTVLITTYNFPTSISLHTNYNTSLKMEN